MSTKDYNSDKDSYWVCPFCKNFVPQGAECPDCGIEDPQSHNLDDNCDVDDYYEDYDFDDDDYNQEDDKGDLGV